MARSSFEFHFHRAGLLAMGSAVLIVTFAGGFALGYGTRPSASAVTAAGSCSWTTLPTFPGALMVQSREAGIAYRVYGAPLSQVVRFYQAGADQTSWTFSQTSARGAFLATFRVDGPSGCRGILRVQSDVSGGTLIEANSLSMTAE